MWAVWVPPYQASSLIERTGARSRREALLSFVIDTDTPNWQHYLRSTVVSISIPPLERNWDGWPLGVQIAVRPSVLRCRRFQLQCAAD